MNIKDYLEMVEFCKKAKEFAVESKKVPVAQLEDWDEIIQYWNEAIQYWKNRLLDFNILVD